LFIEVVNDLKDLAKLYSDDEEIGIPNPNSAFFFKQKQQQQHLQSSSSQSFHYNDPDMSHLLTAPITASDDAVSITFSALGSTEDLQEANKSGTENDNKQQGMRSSMEITTETSSSICSPEEALSPLPHINIAPPDVPYSTEQQSTIPNRVPLRNEAPINKFLLKPNGSRESTPDYRYSLSSDSQYSSSQFSSDVSDNNRQHLLRYKRDSPEKRTVIAKHNHIEEEQLFPMNSNDPSPSMDSGMLSEIMTSFDQRMISGSSLDHSSNQ